MNNSLTKSKQKILGERGLVSFLVLLSAIIPLSIDIYLPALPTIAKQFGDTKGLTNYTLIGFFIFFGIATLFWGPISEKYGRKKILQIGLVSYNLGTFLCIIATNLESIIFYRIIQAIGGGAVVVVSMAIIKDSFEGKKREHVMAIVQSMAMIAPLIAPVIGSLILKFTSWKGIFVFLLAFGIVSLTILHFLEETLLDKQQGSILNTLSQLIVVMKNKKFSTLMIIFLLSQIASMGFVSSSAYIYVEDFKLSEQTYSLFFAFNAFFLIIGPMLYIKISKKIEKSKIVNISFALMILSGLLICFLGKISPYVFALLLVPFSFFSSVIRPLGTNLMFEQKKVDAGSAASLMNFIGILLGSIGMQILAKHFINNITMLGIIILITSALSLILWNLFDKQKIQLKKE